MRPAILASSSLLAVALAVTACGGAVPEPNAASNVRRWSYEGDTGPEHWASLDPAFAQCGSGQRQGPIDLPAHADRSPTKAPLPHWEPIPLKVINTGYSIQVDDPAPSSLTFEGTSYTLKQFHFHSPAEHTIEGRTFDAEMHLVHKSAEGKVLVVALLFQRGRENEALRPMWDAIPMTVRADAVDVGKTIDVASLLPKAPSFFRYDGSLTIPPCTEGLTWLVMEPDADAPLQMSDAQAGRLRAATHGGTNRPRQALNGRVVVELAP